jgi:hypothetical protein
MKQVLQQMGPNNIYFSLNMYVQTKFSRPILAPLPREATFRRKSFATSGSTSFQSFSRFTLIITDVVRIFIRVVFLCGCIARLLTWLAYVF